jgi:hypothetical protein
MTHAISLGLGLSFALLASGTAHSQAFVPKGTKGTLTVNYEYSAVGKNADKSEPAEWRIARTLTLVVPMSAEAEQPLSATRVDKDQKASADKKLAQVATVQKKLEPTMNDMMKIAERCGEDEACIEKAITEYSNTMDPSLIKSTKADVDAVVKLDAPRYQMWQGLSQKGTYSVDETHRAKTSDPLCSGKPGNQCTREETRKGGGVVPSLASAKDSTIAQLEFDTVKKDVYITLPIPFAGLGFTKQVTSNFPDEKSGTSKDELRNLPGKVPPVTAAVAGDARTVSGTQTLKVVGKDAEGGTLTVKWQFVRQ